MTQRRPEMIADIYKYVKNHKTKVPAYEDLSPPQKTLVDALSLVLHISETSKYFHVIKKIIDLCLYDMNEDFEGLFYNVLDEIDFLHGVKNGEIEY